MARLRHGPKSLAGGRLHLFPGHGYPEHDRAFLGPPEGSAPALNLLTEGLRLVLGNLASRIGAPERSGKLIELRRGGGARDCGAELVVDHGSRPLSSWGRVGQANPVRKSEAFR